MSSEKLRQYKFPVKEVQIESLRGVPGGREEPGGRQEVGLTPPPCLHSGLSEAVNISSAPPVNGRHASPCPLLCVPRPGAPPLWALVSPALNLCKHLQQSQFGIPRGGEGSGHRGSRVQSPRSGSQALPH